MRKFVWRQSWTRTKASFSLGGCGAVLLKNDFKPSKWSLIRWRKSAWLCSIKLDQVVSKLDYMGGWVQFAFQVNTKSNYKSRLRWKLLQVVQFLDPDQNRTEPKTIHLTTVRNFATKIRSISFSSQTASSCLPGKRKILLSSLWTKGSRCRGLNCLVAFLDLLTLCFAKLRFLRRLPNYPNCFTKKLWTFSYVFTFPTAILASLFPLFHRYLVLSETVWPFCYCILRRQSFALTRFN